MIKNLNLLCAVLLLTGCWEARRHSGRIVALSFPNQIKAGVKLSKDDAQTQEALKLIDSVLVSDGFTRDPNRPTAEETTLLASYKKPATDGVRQIGVPHVFFRNNRIVVVVIETGNRSGRVTSETKRICRLLENKLGGRYGADRVRVLDADG